MPDLRETKILLDAGATSRLVVARRGKECRLLVLRDTSGCSENVRWRRQENIGPVSIAVI